VFFRFKEFIMPVLIEILTRLNSAIGRIQ